MHSSRNTVEPKSCLSLEDVIFPEEARVNLGVARPSRRVAIWLQWGVVEVVVEGGGTHGGPLGVQSSRANRLPPRPAGNGTLLWGLEFGNFRVHVSCHESKVLI